MHANTASPQRACASKAAFAGRVGLRRSAENPMARKSCEQPGVPDHLTRLRAHSMASHAQARASRARSMTTRAVGVFSTARRNRYHDASEMRRAVSGAMSPRSIATKPNPPAWSNRSVALRACSALPPQRIHSKRSSPTPAAAADVGSNASLASTMAQNSSRSVACANREKMRLVRPEETAPKMSVTDPRGMPPNAVSKLWIPAGRSSGAMRSCSFKSMLCKRDVAIFGQLRIRLLFAAL